MPAAARKLKATPQLKTWHATMLVTRAEEWWVEAESAEEAQSLLGAGQGHHSATGACVCVEVEGRIEEAD